MSNSDNESLISYATSETQIISDAPPPPKRKVWRPRIDPKLLVTADPDYFKNHYYEKRKVLIECPVCSQMITKNSFSAHKKSMKCRFKGLQNENLC